MNTDEPRELVSVLICTFAAWSKILIFSSKFIFILTWLSLIETFRSFILQIISASLTESYFVWKPGLEGRFDFICGWKLNSKWVIKTSNFPTRNIHKSKTFCKSPCKIFQILNLIRIFISTALWGFVENISPKYFRTAMTQKLVYVCWNSKKYHKWRICLFYLLSRFEQRMLLNCIKQMCSIFCSQTQTFWLKYLNNVKWEGRKNCFPFSKFRNEIIISSFVGFTYNFYMQQHKLEAK